MLLHLGHALPRMSIAISAPIIKGAPGVRINMIPRGGVINLHRGHFSVSGRSFPQTGHVFSVDLMCRSALQWEQVILLSFILFSSVIYCHPWSKLTPVAPKIVCPFGNPPRSVQPLRSWPERLSLPVLRSIILQFVPLFLSEVTSPLRTRSNLGLEVRLRSLPERLSLPLLLSSWDTITATSPTLSGIH